MVKNSNRDSTTARYTSPHDADVKTLCKQECARIVHSKRCRYALIPLVLFFTILVIYAIFDYPLDPPPPFCSTAACIRTGWNLKQTMNRQVKPCDDFYAYVCGGNWTKLSDKRKIGGGGGDDGDGAIRNLLAGNASQEDAKAVQKAKLMFKVCTERDTHNPNDFSKLGDFYSRFGLPTVPTVLKRTEGWNMGEDHQFDWVDSVARIKRSLGLNVLIGVDVSDSNQLVLGYPDLPKNWDASTQITQVAQLLEPVQKVASDMLQVAVAINPGWNVTNQGNKFEDLGYQVQDFFRLLPNRSTTTSGDDHAIFSDLDPHLQRYLNLLFNDLPNSKLSPTDRLQISSPDRQYLKDLVLTLSTQYPEQIELYIWGLVSTFLARHRFNRAPTNETCSEQVRDLMRPALAFMEFDVNNRDNVTFEPMLDRLRAELEQTILAIDWMDAPSRNGSLTAVNAKIEVLERVLNATKLEQYFEQVGDGNLENWINGLGFVSTNRLKSWRTTSESRWDPPFLQKPFRDLGLDSLNYGSLGVALTSELLSGLDSRLSNSSLEWYQSQSKCFVDDRSIREAAGLALALQAYQKRTEQEVPLPELGFTGEQALFVSYGWQICSDERSERSKSRINEAVRNVRDFGKAFECSAGDEMNPEVRCDVW